MSIPEIVQKQQVFFQSGQTRPRAFREGQLKKLQALLWQNESAVAEALRADLHKSAFDAYCTETGLVLAEIRHALRHLRRWMKPRRVRTPLTHLGSVSRIHQEPFGIALVIAPWNYPFYLAMAPLIGAIAAGNCVVLKPSELASHTSRLLANLINHNFEESYIHVVEGDVEASRALLQERFDYIFFTGSRAVGQYVMEAAARYLTPVTLELGGKSPCIVHSDANIKLAARRIVWGKFLNAGQTCVAPDYLFVQRDVKNTLVEAMRSEIRAFYGNDALHNPGFAHIISDRHFDRLCTYLQQGRVLIGGAASRPDRVIEPTVLDDVAWDSPVMQEEIFGPILPVLTYDLLADAIRWLQTQPKPLALYAFTESSAVQSQILHNLTYGGGCMNDTLLHLATPYLPFGGVGASGFGGYHGWHSFQLFSHRKGVVTQTTRFDLPFRYGRSKRALQNVKRFLH